MINVIMVTLLIAISFLIAILFALLFLRGKIKIDKVNAFGDTTEVDKHNSDRVIAKDAEQTDNPDDNEKIVRTTKPL